MKKALSLIMAICMIAALCSFSVAAAPEGTAISSAADFAAMDPAGTYYLANDITISEPYVNPFTGTIDGNGKTVTMAADFADKGWGTAIMLGAADGSKDANIANLVYTIKNVTFDGFTTKVIRAQGVTLNVENTVIENANVTSDLIWIDYTDATLNGVTFKNNTTTGTYNALINYNSNVNNDSESDLTITNCVFDQNNANFSLVLGQDGGEFTLTNNKFTNNNVSGTGIGASVVFTAMNSTMTGNYFAGNTAEKAAIVAGPWTEGEFEVVINENAFADTITAVHVEEFTSLGATTSFDLSKNYWNGAAPAYNFTGAPTVELADYYMTYTDGALGELVTINYVAEVNGMKYETLQAAIDAANGNVVTLLAPIVVNAGEALEIDLKGQTVAYTSDVAGVAMITNKGTLVINDTVGGGVINFTYVGEPDSNYGKGNYTISNCGDLTLNGGTVKNSTAAMKHASYAIDNNSINSIATLTINGGAVENGNNYAIRQIGGNNKNTFTLNGGTVTGTRAVWIQAPGSATTAAPEIALNIAGGKLVATGESGGYTLAIYSYTYGNSLENIAINITDGELVGDIALSGGKNKTVAETLNISGGTIDGALYSYAENDVATKTVNVSGGTFTAPVEYVYCAEGFIPEANSDGTYGVKEGYYAAQVGDKYYLTLNEAAMAAANGDVIKLMSDLDMGMNMVFVQNGAIIDLNGHTLTAAAAAAFGSSSIVDNGETKGLLIVPKGNLAMAQATYPMLPIWNEAETGYVFVAVKDQSKQSENAGVENSFIVDFKPSIKGGGVENAAVFGDGALDNGISMKFVIKCYNGDVMDHHEDFDISDELIAKVYTNSTSIRFTVTGANNTYDRYDVVVEITSNTGVTYTSTVIATYTPTASADAQ